MSKKILDDLQAKLGKIIGSSPAKDIERNIRATLTQTLSRLDVVTKEEYEVVRLALVQMESKMLSLEARLAELEQKHRYPKTPPSDSKTGK